MPNNEDGNNNDDNDSIQHIKIDDDEEHNDDDTFHTSNNPTNAGTPKDIDQTDVDDAADADDERKEEALSQTKKKRRRESTETKYKRRIKSLPFDARGILLSNAIEDRVIIGNETIEKEIVGMPDLIVGQSYPVAVAVTTIEPHYDPIVYLQDLNLQQLRDFARIVGVRNASKMSTYQCRYMIAVIVLQLKERRMNRGGGGGDDDDVDDEDDDEQQQPTDGETDAEADEQKLKKMRSFINKKLLSKKVPTRQWNIQYSTDRRYNTLIRLINILFSEECRKRFVRYSHHIQTLAPLTTGAILDNDNDDDENTKIIHQFFELISTHFFTSVPTEHEVIGKNKKKRKKYTNKKDTNDTNVAAAATAAATIPDTPGTAATADTEGVAAGDANATDDAVVAVEPPVPSDPFLVLDCNEIPDPNGFVKQRLENATFSTSDYFPLTGSVLWTWTKDFLLIRKHIRDAVKRQVLSYDPANPTAVDIYPYVEQTMIGLQKDRIVGVFPAYYFYIKSLACPELDAYDRKSQRRRVLDDVWNDAGELSVSSMSGTDDDDDDDNEENENGDDDGENDGDGDNRKKKKKKKKQKQQQSSSNIVHDISFIKTALHKFNKNQNRAIQIQAKLVTDQLRLAQLQQISSIVAIRNTIDSGKDPDRYQKYTKAIEALENKLFG